MIVRGNLARADAASTARANTSFTRSQFALIFWDILFAPVDGVFETPFQTAPLDLATDAFSIGASRGQVTSHSAGRTNPRRDGRLISGRSAVRRPAINERLAAIAAGEGPALLKETDDRERPLETFAVGIRWDRYTQEDLLEIVEVRRRRCTRFFCFCRQPLNSLYRRLEQCIGPQALAAILTVFVEEYGHRTGGIPDLW
jgi:Fanconi-associated nuclease 1